PHLVSGRRRIGKLVGARGYRLRAARRQWSAPGPPARENLSQLSRPDTCPGSQCRQLEPAWLLLGSSSSRAVVRVRGYEGRTSLAATVVAREPTLTEIGGDS